METDKTTLNDLSVFNHEEEFSIFHKLDFTRTAGGRDQLKNIFSSSYSDIVTITGIQQTLQLIIDKKEQWPLSISNGTIMVIQKFFESPIDPIPANPSPAAAYSYKLLHGPDFSLVKYSAGHCFDFIKGML